MSKVNLSFPILYLFAKPTVTIIVINPLVVRLDMVYCGETDDVCRVLFQGQERLYRRLHVLEFDSDRKRMSVILQFPDDTIWLLCKGAESTILPRCDFGPVAETESHIKDYAMVPLMHFLNVVSNVCDKFCYDFLDGIANISDCSSSVIRRGL